MKIIKTSEALPKSGRYVLAWLESAKIPMRAMWADQHTLPLGDDADPEWGEYSEEKDEYFCPAGWYEMNQFEEQHWGVSGNVVAWCELPRLDHQCLAQIEEPGQVVVDVREAFARRYSSDPADPMCAADLAIYTAGWHDARAGAAPAAVAPQGEYPQLPLPAGSIEVIDHPGGITYGSIRRSADAYTADQLRAYFDLGRHAAPALEAPSAKPGDLVAVPRDLIGSACCAIDTQRAAPKTLAELRRYTTGDLSRALEAPAAPQQGFRPGKPGADVEVAWLLVRSLMGDGEGGSDEIDTVVLGLRGDDEQWLVAGDWRANSTRDSVHDDGGWIVGWLPYELPAARLAAAPQAPAAPSYPTKFGPNDWVMDIAGVIVKLEEWEPGAVKAHTIYGKRHLPHQRLGWSTPDAADAFELAWRSRPVHLDRPSDKDLAKHWWQGGVDMAAPAAPSGWVPVPRKITDAMIDGALAAHYGKKRLAAAGGSGGIDMTVDGTNYSGADAMRRMWRGALAAVAPAPAAPAVDAVPLLARHISEWHEEDGDVSWWAWCGRDWAGEPAWIGRPTDDAWPGYHTHWTAHPAMPGAIAAQAKEGGAESAITVFPLHGDESEESDLSEWQPGTSKPAIEGRYLREFDEGEAISWFTDGKWTRDGFFDSDIQDAPWRGLAAQAAAKGEHGNG